MPAAGAGGDGVGNKVGHVQPSGDGQLRGGPGEAVSVPAVLQCGRYTGNLGRNDLDAVVVKFLSKVEAFSVPWHEACGADAGAVSDGADCLVQGTVVAGDFQGGVGSAPVCHLADCFGGRSVCRIEDMVCTELEGKFAAAGNAVHGDNACSIEPRQLRGDLTGHSESENGYGVADMDICIEHDV